MDIGKRWEGREGGSVTCTAVSREIFKKLNLDGVVRLGHLLFAASVLL